MLDYPDERERMGQLGYKRFSDKWNNETQIDGLIRFYEQVLN
jgi:hypothetical protein